MRNGAQALSVGNEVSRVVVSRQEIARRVRRLARQIEADYAGGELTILAVLTGSLIFLSDLIRRLPLKMKLTLVSVSSYPGKFTTSCGPRFTLPKDCDLSGKDVLVVDDILDSGLTLKALLDVVAAMGPGTLQTCVLLKKDRPDLPGRMDCDYIGFNVRRDFLVGYGLDYDNFYRNLPDIRVLDLKLLYNRRRRAAKRAPGRKARP